MKFSNFFSAPIISDGRGKIKINDNLIDIHKEYNDIINNGNPISELKKFILKYSNTFKNERMFSGLSKDQLIENAKTEYDLFLSEDSKSKYYGAFIDESDNSKFKNNSREWAKEKVMYYSDKSFFGIPCTFLCMMKENWIHGNFEILGGHNSRWLSN